MRSLQRRETTSSIVERRKQVSKRALITSWIQNSPFHCEHVTYPQNLRCFLTPIRWSRHKATRSKTKKLTFSLEATKFCLVLRSTPAVPTQTVFRLRINTFLVRKILWLVHQNKRLRFIACWFSFTLRWNYRVKIKLRSDGFPFEAGNQFNAGVLSQSASSNHALLITKSALLIKKKCPLSQPISIQ